MIDNGYAFGWVKGPPPPQPQLGLGKGALFAVGHGALQGVWGGGGDMLLLLQRGLPPRLWLRIRTVPASRVTVPRNM